MRKAFSLALLGSVLCLVGMTKDATATVTISLVWATCGGGAGCSSAFPGIGTNRIAVFSGGGQTLRLDVFLSHDEPGGIGRHAFSLNFDTLLQNSLDFGPMGAAEWLGFDADLTPWGYAPYEPITTGVTTLESTVTTAGRVNTIESGDLTSSLPASGTVYTVGTFTATAPARYLVARVFFTKTPINNNPSDVFSGLFNSPFDSILDSTGTAIPGSRLSFGTASLFLVPEPGTVSLLGLGFVGLVLAARRSRRS